MYRFLLPITMAAAALPAFAADFTPAVAVSGEASGGTAMLEAAVPLTLPAALSLALQANPDLSAARHELAAQDGAMLQAGAHPNPELATLVEDTRRSTRTTTIQLNQTIELGGKRAARIDVARHDRELAAIALAARRADTGAAVAGAFVDVLAAQQRLVLAEAAADLARQSSEIAARRVGAGKASPVEATRAKVAQSGVLLELGQAGRALAGAPKRLAALWGNPAPRFSAAEGSLEQLPAMPEPARLTERLAHSPALRLAQTELERRRAMAQLEQRRRIPDVTVSVGVKRSEELGRNQALIGLAVPLPFFDNNQGNRLEALRRGDKARDALSAAALDANAELEAACEQLAGARQEAAALRDDIVPGAASAYRAAATGFEFGKFAFLDVLDAQRTLLQVQTQYLGALTAAHHAAARIARLLGDDAATTP